MTQTWDEQPAPPRAVDLARLALSTRDQAVVDLAAAGQATPETVRLLAEAALEHADTDTDSANRWLDTAAAIVQMLGDEPELRGYVAYARARLFVELADLASAEAALWGARANWSAAGATDALVRSDMGLTHVLTLQGRYQEAEAAIDRALASLESQDQHDPALLHQLAKARANRATLLVYQDRHREALEESDRAQQVLARCAGLVGEDASWLASLRLEGAHLALNRATALMFLDQPDDAESALQTALTGFDLVGSVPDRGRVHTNLGALYLRTGRYAAALSAFDRASRDLLGTLVPAELSADTSADELAQLRQSDVLLLDRASAYLALNLIPEAIRALQQCERLFRGAAMPHELGQSLYALAMVHLRTGDMRPAEQALTEAAQLFFHLSNDYWLNRVAVARSLLAYQRGDAASAADDLDVLLARIDEEMRGPWDTATLAEARLLRLQLHLDAGELSAARGQGAMVRTAVDGVDPAIATPTSLLPHLQLRLETLLGRIDRAQGDAMLARHHFQTAVDLLESQRASLPLEEIRATFLDDKVEVYGDLALSLLDAQDAGSDGLAEAFFVVEQARSRALLDRLLASVDETVAHIPTEEQAELLHAAGVRRRLHWLYNQLLSGVDQRQPDGMIAQEIRQCEAVLQSYHWRADSLLAQQAQPAGLEALQSSLAPDQQAIVYYIAENEVLAFVVRPGQVAIHRQICHASEVSEAYADLRFQLGRVELGADYVARHGQRLLAGVRHSLNRLYQLVYAPLQPAIRAKRLLIVPFGSLHLLPFHAFWDDSAYLLQHHEIHYAPSASVAIYCAAHADELGSLRNLAALALTDANIPQARQEIELAAGHFDHAWLYVDAESDRRHLELAARQADVLHLATHGLFRSDNPFFSALKLADGWIDVREIYHLPLRAPLVVLSACESGAGQVWAGDEVIGLARGFLGAGARRLVVSLWNVHDASAAALMDRFYAALTADDVPDRPAAALRSAQLAAIRRGDHPYFWAPFFAIG